MTMETIIVLTVI